MSTWAHNRIFDRYIEALIGLKKTDSNLKKWHDNALSLRDVLNANDTLNNAFRNPTIDKADKANVLNDLAKALKLDTTFTRTLLVFVQQGRSDILKGLLARMDELLKKEMGVLTAHVTSAEKLTSTQSKNLEKTLGKNIDINTQIDPEILGGLIIQVDSWRMDDSVRGKIERLTRKLEQAA